METWGNIYCLTGAILLVFGAIDQNFWELLPGLFLVVVGLLAQRFAFEPLDCDDPECPLC